MIVFLFFGAVLLFPVVDFTRSHESTLFSVATFGSGFVVLVLAVAWTAVGR